MAEDPTTPPAPNEPGSPAPAGDVPAPTPPVDPAAPDAAKVEADRRKLVQEVQAQREAKRIALEQKAAAETARDQAVETARAEAFLDVASAKIEAAAARAQVVISPEVLALVDLSKFRTADGTFDTSKVEALVAGLRSTAPAAPAAPAAPTVPVTPPAGPMTPGVQGAPPTDDFGGFFAAWDAARTAA